MNSRDVLLDQAHRELSEGFRFTEYHEPLKRWPFQVQRTLASKVRRHGSFPSALMEHSATKGRPGEGAARRAKERGWGLRGPSDRIGANFTPTAKHLTVSGLRQFRMSLRREALRRKQVVTEQSAPSKAQRIKVPPRQPRPLESRSRTESVPADTDRGDPAEGDSVRTSVRRRRLEGGQEAFSKKMDGRIPGLIDEDDTGDARKFMSRFPYKSCYRCTSSSKLSQKRLRSSQPFHVRRMRMLEDESGPSGYITPKAFVQRQAEIADQEIQKVRLKPGPLAKIPVRPKSKNHQGMFMHIRNLGCWSFITMPTIK